jgi:hypothetical protein
MVVEAANRTSTIITEVKPLYLFAPLIFLLCCHTPSYRYLPFTIVSYSCFIVRNTYPNCRVPTEHKDDVGHVDNDSFSITSSLRWQTAKHALRCLIGCNIGEGGGAAIGFVLGWDMISTLVLAVGLAFAIGYAFTIIPMLKTIPFRQAARVTVIGDTASISAMEITENSLAFIIPGFMHSAITDVLFWLGLGIILPAGYAVAYPAMYWAMKREQKKERMQRHHH